jgi:hypothetical protein
VPAGRQGGGWRARSDHHGFLKKRGDDLEIVASTNEGGWDWRLISLSDDSKGKKPLNPF